MFDHDDEIHPAPPSDDKLKTVTDKDALIAEINKVLKGPQSKEAENELVGIIQKQRTLLLDIATQTFINKPNNPKLLDSINTILAQLEKTVRDDRKERLKDRELEDNRANFATFVNALNEVAAGKLVIPTYGNQAFVLDPLAPIIRIEDPDDEIKDDELYQGRQIVDSKEIEKTFDEDDLEVEVNTTDAPEDDDEEFDPES
ncbi:hypothetical protein YUBABA_01340 [Serratia phage vB_SmaM-Yubaba]|nr:hypothetical protein SUREIYA_01020 [Serratia phage vB_SmaM-Sureiya]UQT03340.1 hypothetical protein YUBABA_01340 [Serratia phage vB_SmaM-Yubaba]